jgi:hypothetical protein
LALCARCGGRDIVAREKQFGHLRIGMR